MKNNYTESIVSDKVFAKELSEPSKNFYYRDDLYKELVARSRNEKVISGVYKEILKYLTKIFSQLVYRDDQEDIKRIPCWHGQPEKIIARLKQDSNIVIPVASILRVSDDLDTKRRRTDKIINFDTYFDKEKDRAIRVASLNSAPTNIKYKLSLWTKYHEDMDQLAEQVKRMFHPHLLIPTKYSSHTVSFLEQESSNIDVTIADGKDRLIRRSFLISLETYIPNPKFMITSSGKIEELNFDLGIN